MTPQTTYTSWIKRSHVSSACSTAASPHADQSTQSCYSGWTARVESRRVCFECVNVCVCVCVTVWVGVCLCKCKRFLFCFVLSPPPQPSARPGGKEDWENREAFPKKLSTRFFFFYGQEDKKRVIRVRSPADSVSHTVRANWVKRQRPNEGRSAAPVICCQIPAERISTV